MAALRLLVRRQLWDVRGHLGARLWLPVALVVAVGLACAGLACGTMEYPNAILDSEGNQIRVGHIEQILEDETLTDFEKDQALEELGITDELLRQHLIETGVGG